MTLPPIPPPPGQPEPVASSVDGLSRQLDMQLAKLMVSGLTSHLAMLAGVDPGTPWVIWPDGMVCALTGEQGPRLRGRVEEVAAGRRVADEVDQWLREVTP